MWDKRTRINNLEQPTVTEEEIGLRCSLRDMRGWIVDLLSSGFCQIVSDIFFSQVSWLDAFMNVSLKYNNCFEVCRKRNVLSYIYIHIYIPWIDTVFITLLVRVYVILGESADYIFSPVGGDSTDLFRNETNYWLHPKSYSFWVDTSFE